MKNNVHSPQSPTRFRDRMLQHKQEKLQHERWRIMHIFKLSEEDLIPTPREHNIVAHMKEKCMTGHLWRDNVKTYAAQADIPAGHMQPIAEQIMDDLHAAFQLRYKVLGETCDGIRKSYKDVFRSSDSKERIINLYVNHLTNHALLKLEATGLPQEQAYRFLGRIIKDSLESFESHPFHAYVYPEQNRKTPIQQRIGVNQNYWQDLATILDAETAQKHGR